MKQKPLYATKYSNLSVPKLAEKMQGHAREAKRLAATLATEKGKKTKGVIASIQLESEAQKECAQEIFKRMRPTIEGIAKKAIRKYELDVACNGKRNDDKKDIILEAQLALKEEISGLNGSARPYQFLYGKVSTRIQNFIIAKIDSGLEEAAEIMFSARNPPKEIPSPFEFASASQRELAVEKVLNTLEPKEALIARMQFGIGGGDALSPDEIAAELKCTPTWVRILQKRVMRKLRRPSRANMLREFHE